MQSMKHLQKNYPFRSENNIVNMQSMKHLQKNYPFRSENNIVNNNEINITK